MRSKTWEPPTVKQAAKARHAQEGADNFITRNESWLSVLSGLVIVAAVPLVSRALSDDHSSIVPEWLTALATTVGAVALGLSVGRTETTTAKGLQYAACLAVCALGLAGYGALLISHFGR